MSSTSPPPTPTLYKRKDFLGVDQEAQAHPNRTYYFRKNVDLEEVIETCSKRLVTHPNDLKALFLRGTAYFKRQAYDTALEDLNKVINLDILNIESYYYRGITHQKLNQMEKAIEDLTVVLENNSDHVNAAFARAACFNAIGQFSRAIEDYNFALLKDESNTNNGTHGGQQPSTPQFDSRNLDFSFSEDTAFKTGQGVGSSSSSSKDGADSKSPHLVRHTHDGINTNTSPNMKLQFPSSDREKSLSAPRMNSPREEVYDNHLKSLLSEAQVLYEQTENTKLSTNTNRISQTSSVGANESVLELPPPIAAAGSRSQIQQQQTGTNSPTSRPSRRPPPARAAPPLPSLI